MEELKKYGKNAVLSHFRGKKASYFSLCVQKSVQWTNFCCSNDLTSSGALCLFPRIKERSIYGNAEIVSIWMHFLTTR